MSLDFAKLKATSKLKWDNTAKIGAVAKPRAGADRLKKNQEQETPGLINGRQAGSTIEWNAARALWMLGWDFLYQVSVRGGRDIRGGQVLDFLIITVPMWTPMPVNGRYWHGKKEQAGFEIQEMISGLREMGWAVNEPIVLWEENALTIQDAYNWIFSKIGRG